MISDKLLTAGQLVIPCRSPWLNANHTIRIRDYQMPSQTVFAGLGLAKSFVKHASADTSSGEVSSPVGN